MAVNKARDVLVHGFRMWCVTGTQPSNEEIWTLSFPVSFAITTYVTLSLRFMHSQNKYVALNKVWRQNAVTPQTPSVVSTSA